MPEKIKPLEIEKEEALDKLLEDDEFVIIFSWKEVAFIMFFLYMIVVIEALLTRKNGNTNHQSSRHICANCRI
jgi:hypothetical protein